MKTIPVKICGLTSAEDAKEAFSSGASFGGIISHPESPRYVEPDRIPRILAEIPKGKRVWVAVEPSSEEVESAFESGFDFAQIHFDPDSDYDPIKFSEKFGPERLWLAPRLSNPADFRPEWVGKATVILIDGFSRDRMGGTGQRVEGKPFAELMKRFPEQRFSIAGGISPLNVGEVLWASQAKQIDVSSGIESAPGIKEPQKIRALFDAVKDFQNSER